MVPGRLRTRQRVVNDWGRVCARGDQAMVGHDLGSVVRLPPKPAEAAAGSD
jgi:hypothetical protein